MDYSTLLNKLVIFVVIMVIGYVFARKGITDKAFTRTASRLVLDVFMSGTILNAMFSVQNQIGSRELVQVLLFPNLAIVFSFAVSFIMTRLVRPDKAHAPVFELLCALGNTMFVGLPVVDALMGPMAVLYISLSNIAFNLMTYSYGVWLLMGGGKGAKLRLRDMFSVPLVVTLIGLLVLLLKPPVPSVVRELSGALAGATMPLSMLVIGSSLGGVSLFDAFRNKELYLMSFAKLLICPVLFWLLSGFVIADPVLRMTCTVIAGCPSGIIITVLSIQYERDYVYASEGVLQCTTLSMLTIPALVFLLFR